MYSYKNIENTMSVFSNMQEWSLSQILPKARSFALKS